MEPIKIKDIVTATGGVLLQGEEDGYIRSVTINSNEVGEAALFVPLIGEKVDAHRFISSAFEHGAAASFTSRKDVEGSGVLIFVEDTKMALQDLASFYRSRFTIPVVGITGSVGKTTTKEMISAALETTFCVCKTAGNRNSQVGLPLTVLEIEEKHEAAVIEMGMSERGEMEKLAAVARPTIGVITNIGVSHIAQLGSKETIRQEKCNLADYFNPDSVLYVNGDDPLLRELADGKDIPLDEKTKEALKAVPVVTFGQAAPAAHYAADVRIIEDRAVFSYEKPETKERVPIELSIAGLHNVNNALAALAVAQTLGIPAETAGEGLKKYQPLAMRGQIEQLHGMKLIDDTYNASPDSMKSGIKMLTSLSGLKRKIAVLADVLELGKESEALHREVGIFIGEESTLDCLVTVGEEGRHIAEGAKECRREMEIYSFAKKEEAGDFLQSYLKEGDGILVKGSRGMHMEEIVARIKER